MNQQDSWKNMAAPEWKRNLFNLNCDPEAFATSTRSKNEINMVHSEDFDKIFIYMFSSNQNQWTIVRYREATSKRAPNNI
jgi:hypothetical protein